MAPRLVLVAALFLGAIFSACGEDNDSPPEPDAPAVYCPMDDSSGFDANDLIGLEVKAASQAAKEHRCTVRVVEEDGDSLARTDDLRANRINVATEDGTITKIDGVY